MMLKDVFIDRNDLKHEEGDLFPLDFNKFNEFRFFEPEFGSANECSNCLALEHLQQY